MTATETRDQGGEDELEKDGLWLYTGDSDGMIRIWDVSALLAV